jgi:DNA-directed RNA polymerase specialized sigma24 family protein
MMASRFPEPGPRAGWLADPVLRENLERFVRRKLSGDEARDVVQSTIADALASESAPLEEENFRRFVFGIARNKVVDHYRQSRRETADDTVGDFVHTGVDPVSARDLLRWAEEELPSSEDKSTLEWMLREADGDKLEHIAEEAKVPAPRVRQRVSRLRRYLRERWAAQLAAVSAVGVVLLVMFAWWKSHEKVPEIAHEKPELEQGRKVRRDALERCQAQNYAECLAGLDRAKRLDPAGDARPEVQEARRIAGKALEPPPAPSSLLEPTPTTTLAPKSSAPELSSSERPKPKPKTNFNAKPVPTEFMNSDPSNPKPAPQKPEQKAPEKKTTLPMGSKAGSNSIDFPVEQKK